MLVVTGININFPQQRKVLLTLKKLQIGVDDKSNNVIDQNIILLSQILNLTMKNIKAVQRNTITIGYSAKVLPLAHQVNKIRTSPQNNLDTDLYL